MKEEFITLNVIKFLKSIDWKIIAYDFPQSGTGITFHPNNREDGTKNIGMINPDIIASKNNILIFMENKTDYYSPDIKKLKEIKKGLFSESIKHKLKIESNSIITGIALRKTNNNIDSIKKHIKDIDFFMVVNKDGAVEIIFSSTELN